VGFGSKVTELASVLSLPFHTARRKKEQWLSPASLTALRAARLKSVIEAARGARYYREVLANLPLERLPFLTKRVLAQHGIDAFLTRARAGLLSVTTSGSTGEPTVFLRSPLEEAEFSARWWRVYESYGGRARDTLLNIGRTNPKPRRGAVSLMRRLGVLPKIENVSVAAPIAEAVGTVHDFAPTFITGYASSIERMADYIASAGLDMKPPKAVICGAMDVTDHCRALVRKAFGAPSVNVYATNELGVIAWECPRRPGALHINDDMLILEIVGPDGDRVPEGEIGEVVLTSLTLRSMPLIRYRTGDLAARIPGQCPCGRGLATMTTVQGRTSHTITGPAGQQVTGPLLATAFGACGAYEWVRRFQVHEAADGLLRILVEPRREPHSQDTTQLLAAIERTIGSVFTLQLELIEELPLAPNGKFQFVLPLSSGAPRR
jgi:phenylacetate-CoA ligase